MIPIHIDTKRRRLVWVAAGVVFVGALATVGVWRELVSDDGDTVFVPGFDVELAEADRPAVPLLEGPDWVFEQTTFVDGSGCVRIRIADRTTECVSIEYDDGTSSVGVVRAPDGRAFVQVYGGPSLGPVRVFTSAGDELITPVVPDIAGSGAVALAELAVSEEPYGIQIFGADGYVISVQSLVGWLD